MSCRPRTSDLDLFDFYVAVLASSLSCHSNRSHGGLTRISQGKEGASPLHWAAVTETGGRKGFPGQVLRTPGQVLRTPG